MFDFKSKEQRQEEANLFFERLFPYGLNQREALENVLKQLFPKHNSVSVIYHYIDAKDKLLRNSKNEGFTMALKSLKKLKPKLSDAELRELLLLMKLELEITDMSEFPTAESIRNS